MDSQASSAGIRKAFLDYFSEHGHEVVASSSLVPAGDPTLLFTNAGMVQFKDVFLGREKRPYARAVSSQRCVRAGGKHNDLENVGYTARHHTFFEMLGNFSFGDYFKREAIEYAWEFLTVVLRLPPERLWVTVYEEDDEAADIWLKELKVDPARFSRIGAEDNFWSMGDTGPCGPCSEIFYDHGPEVAGGPPGSPDADGDRYIEIWNLVFMQYDRAADGSLTPLPRPSVDTGMGLERLAAVLQGVHSNYEIDLFAHLIDAVAALAGSAGRDNASLKVVADHIRSCAFLVVDGVTPSNEGRGYVLRRIIRRAIRHGHKLGLREPFFWRLVAPLADEMGAAYPELIHQREQIERVLRQEEERFAETLEQGLHILDQTVAGLAGREIPGEAIFRLYDTYGFPVDLTGDIARERGLTLDMAGFEREMAQQRERARAASRFSATSLPRVDTATHFSGYDRLHDEGRVVALFDSEGQPVERLEEGQSGIVALDRTPFYAESGGQIGDRGQLVVSGGEFTVDETRKSGEAHLHIGHVSRGRFCASDRVDAHVTGSERRDTERNHSATHLLHAALRKVLGSHVQQKGSLVEAARLRFDFAHFEPVSSEQLAAIEQQVNDEILANREVVASEMAIDEALASGAMALFGEKYGDQVRVLRMGDFSVELCGGTHVGRTGDIGLFRIVSEGGVAAGVRRIEAVTGHGALRQVTADQCSLARLGGLLKSDRDSLEEKAAALVERLRGLEKEVERLKSQLAGNAGSDLAAQAREIAGLKVLAARIDDLDAKALRETVDRVRDQLGECAVLIASVVDGKVALVAGVSKGATSRLRAGDLVNAVAQPIGGRGGGRPDMAQAGGGDAAQLDAALQAVYGWVEARLD